MKIQHNQEKNKKINLLGVGVRWKQEERMPTVERGYVFVAVHTSLPF